MKTTMHTIDILVIGAGQAGLALGHYLKSTPYSFLLIDGNNRVGDSWRNRYDLLTLFTPRRYSALPGLAVPRDPEGYPSKDDIADYLESYARHFELPIQMSTCIERLEQVGQEFQAITTDGGRIAAQAVVIATGAFQQPMVPGIADQIAPDVQQFTTDTYHSPTQIPPGAVLVVGDGATGRQIASELVSSHTVWLATGKPRKVLPDRILGQSLFWWMERLGLLKASYETLIGKRLREMDSFPGKHLEFRKLREQGIKVVGRLASATGQEMQFSTGERASVEHVIWAVGYRDRTDWVAIPEAKDEKGRYIERRGISPVPGLYFMGRSWQWSRGSALLHGVGTDAAYLMQPLQDYLTRQAQLDATYSIVPKTQASQPAS